MGGLVGGAAKAAAPPVQMPDPPQPKEPVVMPQADPQAQKMEETRKLAKARARATTRASTIIGGDDTLG